MEFPRRGAILIVWRTAEFWSCPLPSPTSWAKACAFFGGGYLRFFPYWLISRKVGEVVANGRPVVFYIHPREIDPAHPRLPMKAGRAFKSYVNLDTTEPKLRRILRDFPVSTFQQVISNYPELVNSHVA